MCSKLHRFRSLGFPRYCSILKISTMIFCISQFRSWFFPHTYKKVPRFNQLSAFVFCLSCLWAKLRCHRRRENFINPHIFNNLSLHIKGPVPTLLMGTFVSLNKWRPDAGRKWWKMSQNWAYAVRSEWSEGHQDESSYHQLPIWPPMCISRSFSVSMMYYRSHKFIVVITIHELSIAICHRVCMNIVIAWVTEG